MRNWPYFGQFSIYKLDLNKKYYTLTTKMYIKIMVTSRSNDIFKIKVKYQINQMCMSILVNSMWANIEKSNRWEIGPISWRHNDVTICMLNGLIFGEGGSQVGVWLFSTIFKLLTWFCTNHIPNIHIYNILIKYDIYTDIYITLWMMVCVCCFLFTSWVISHAPQRGGISRTPV